MSVRCAASLKAGGEVVMAAGATHTPQILKLSGIGPAKELEHHGIDVVRTPPPSQWPSEPNTAERCLQKGQRGLISQAMSPGELTANC